MGYRRVMVYTKVLKYTTAITSAVFSVATNTAVFGAAIAAGTLLGAVATGVGVVALLVAAGLFYYEGKQQVQQAEIEHGISCYPYLCTRLGDMQQDWRSHMGYAHAAAAEFSQELKALVADETKLAAEKKTLKDETSRR